MYFAELTFTVGHPPADVFAGLADFAAYPQHSAAVHAVEVELAPDGRCLSSWSVDFGDGELMWREEDRVDHERMRIDFRAVDGDIDEMTGQWTVEAASDGSIVGFRAVFDLGLPGLTDVVEPIAADALGANVASIVTGLAKGRVDLVHARQGPAAAAAGSPVDRPLAQAIIHPVSSEAATHAIA